MIWRFILRQILNQKLQTQSPNWDREVHRCQKQIGFKTMATNCVCDQSKECLYVKKH